VSDEEYLLDTPALLIFSEDDAGAEKMEYLLRQAKI
jgi:hypothetical protein